MQEPLLQLALVLFTVAQGVSSVSASALTDGGAVQLNTFNGWKAFEVITDGDDPSGDGLVYSMLSTFDGAGAWLVDPSTLRVQLNHETSDAAISEVDLDLAALQAAIANMIGSSSTGGVSFVLSARQAYDRWSADGGASWTDTSSTSNTSFSRFCSGQAYAPDTFGIERGFVDKIYVTGEEVSGGRLFALDSAQRDLYQLSGSVGSAPGGTGGLPFDAWENAALLDTGETGHVALLLSPDGGSQRMQLYIGEKGKDSSGAASTSFLARNGLAYGSWYYLDGAYPGLGGTSNGSFDTTASGSLSSTKLEDIDTSPSDPTRVVLGDQDSGVFVFDVALVVDAGFDPDASSFTITMISDTSGGANSVDHPDNVDWTDVTTLGGTDHPDGLVFVNEDNDSGEIWRMEPDGSNQLRIASTKVGDESTGIFDASAMVGYLPGSILMTNNQGSPSSLSVLINPDASRLPDPGSAWSDQGSALAGAGGDPLLTGDGPLSGGSNNSLDLTNAAPSATAGLFLAFASAPVPFKGGTLKPFPFLLALITPTSPTGEISLAFVMPSGVPGGVELWVQWAIADGGAPAGVALSNALLGITP